MKSKILLAIIFLAAVLRLYKLDSFPVSLSWDEVAIGYNAFSIIKTGADEYGVKWPLLFQSFNDYKLPGYIYVDALFIKFLGLSEFSVRLPSAIFGTLAVGLFYLLVKVLFSSGIALTAAFFLAISPWHLQFSRAAFEANLALTVVLAGILLLFYGLKNSLAALLATPILALSIYFYYSPRIFVPLILVTFVFFAKDQIKKQLKPFLVGFLLAAVILMPLLLQFFSPTGFKRVREVSIFEDQSVIVDYVDTRAKTNNFASAIFLNRRLPLVFETLHHYFAHFSPGFLFFGDDPNPRHRSAFHGNLYLFEIPLLLAGFWVLAKSKNKIRYFLILWLLTAPLAAAPTSETPHGLRSLLMLPPLVIISTVAVVTFAQNSVRKLLLAGVVLLFLINYLFTYYLIYPQRDSMSWAYGHKQIFEKVANLEHNFDRIIISGHFWKPYIFYLFYNAVDPNYYQVTSTQESVGQYRFGTTYWDSGGKDLEEEDIEKLKGSKTLLAISPNEFANLKNKERFEKITQIKDYAQKQTIFLIGEWHN